MELFIWTEIEKLRVLVILYVYKFEQKLGKPML